MPHCSNCPAKGLPWACAARARPHPRFCELADPDHPDFNPAYVATIRSWTEADQAPPDTDRRRVPQGGWPPESRVASPPYAETQAWAIPARDQAGGYVSQAWLGRARKPPWAYRITAVVCLLDTFGPFRAVVDTLRAQDERPYIVVVDTGSTPEVMARVERLAADSDDMDLIALRLRGVRLQNQSVGIGMDAGFAAVQTEYAYSTHTDLFLKGPDYLSYLLARCDAGTPVVGHRMIPRPDRGDLWEAMAGHTATLYHMPTIRRLGASWNFERASASLGISMGEAGGHWPDPEVAMGLSLRVAGVGARRPGDPKPGPGDPPSVLLIGDESADPSEDEWFVHRRAMTSVRMYMPDLAAARAGALEQAVRDSDARVASWSAPPTPHPAATPGAAPVTMAQIRAVRRCPDFEARSDCGCGVNRCRSGKGRDGDGLVTLGDCLGCLSARPVSPPPTASPPA